MNKVDRSKEIIDSLLKGPDRYVWIKSLSNGQRRLAQGNSTGIKDTTTIRIVPKSAVPHDKKIKYESMVYDCRLSKTKSIE